eukprot:2298334-Alexandrium_andersonii.AAC.1
MPARGIRDVFMEAVQEPANAHLCSLGVTSLRCGNELAQVAGGAAGGNVGPASWTISGDPGHR